MRGGGEVLTAVLLGIFAFTLDAVVHEGLGHGGAALGLGCQPEMLSSAFWSGDCTELSDPEGADRWVAAAGTLANLAVALLAGLFIFAAQPRGTVGFALWLVLVTNLLSGGGYLMVDPLFGFGDWTAFLGPTPSPILKWSLVLLGVGFSSLGLVLGRRQLLPWIGPPGPERRLRSRRLVLAAYLAGATVVPLSALLGPERELVAFTSALSTYLGCSWMVWIALDPLARPSTETVRLRPSAAVWGLGLGSLILLFTVLGPGLALSAR